MVETDVGISIVTEVKEREFVYTESFFFPYKEEEVRKGVRIIYYEPEKNFLQRLKEYFCEKIRGVSMKIKYQSEETPSLALFDLVDTDIRVMFVKEVKGRHNVSLGHIYHAYDKENVRKNVKVTFKGNKR